MFDLMPRRRRFGGELARFRDEMDNLFNRFFDMDVPISRRIFGEEEWTPRVDVSEGKADVTVRAEIPGCEAGDIDVKIDGRTLTISGEKRRETEEEDKNHYRVERSYGSFLRIMDLPCEVDQEKIDATYKKGILKLVFKKSQQTQAKKIDIKTG